MARVEWREIPAAWGSVLEGIEHYRSGGYARTISVFRVEGGLIAEHIYYCTGAWDAETVARHAREAPMAPR